MSLSSPQWKDVKTVAELEKIIEDSKSKPVLLLRHNESNPFSVQVKKNLDQDWSLSASQLDTYIADASIASITDKVITVAGVDDETPQVILFADGVTMYDESLELISFKKIKLALKIVNRTFRWMETRA
ncbi:monothiol bacilliredoxin BrxC family protein [Marinoscillum sp. MHG1-6]|uniref:monothiol bacilliredoxin BrxC family protein n=1 Tax=Marinoscillum sp. MHG1-6 TaxID=2959627 RepID=UPI0021589C3E|nr:monothiol bacilliredoxin BrxC family protein [Marinoscillum sp. MHG1-6]